MTNETLKVLENRRSCRKFKPDIFVKMWHNREE